MNVLFLADNFPPERNAQASRVYERACYWVRWGHQVTVITSLPNFPEGVLYPGFQNCWRQVEHLDGIRVVRVKTYMAPNAGRARRILDFLSFMVSSFCFGLFERRPDIVAATSPQFFAGVAGAMLAWVKRVPFLLEVSDLWPESIVAVGAMRPSFATRLLERVEMWLYRQSSRIVVLTEAFRQKLIPRGVPADHIVTVLNGVDQSRFSPRPYDRDLACEWNIPDDRFVVGYLGTQGMAHGLDNVLVAAARVNQSRVLFLFVGSGADHQRLVALAHSKGLLNVKFIPALPKEKMPGAWSLCDLALVHLRNTPLFETVIPSKIFEAMGMALPILLASPAGEASRILEREGAGLWVPPGDPEALARAVDFLAADPAGLQQYAHRSRDAAPRYSREKQARDYLTVLSQAVSAHHPEEPLAAAHAIPPDSLARH